MNQPPAPPPAPKPFDPGRFAQALCALGSAQCLGFSLLARGDNRAALMGAGIALALAALLIGIVRWWGSRRG